MIILVIDKNKELSLSKLKSEMDTVPADYVESRKDYGDKLVFFYREPYPEMTADELLNSPIICRLTPPKIIHIN